MNSKNLRLRTVDFGKGEVKSEKHMVEIEDELMKVKSKIGKKEVEKKKGKDELKIRKSSLKRLGQIL